MISSFIPKIVVSEGINIFFPEILLFAGLILGLRQFITYPEQQLMLGIFLCILFFSIVAQIFTSDISSMLKSFKEVLYIPIIYWASLIPDKKKLLRNLVLFGCVAYCMNIFLYMQGYAAENTIWSGAETLSSGMSNKGIIFPSFSIVQLIGLAHGIWGSYCVLIFVITLSLYKEKIINIHLMLFSVILFSINMMITISRESILLLLVISLISFFKSGLTFIQRIVILGTLTITLFLIVTMADNLPVVQKLTYTYTSLTENQSEGNFTIRVNTWVAYLKFVAHNLEYILVGLGHSEDNFFKHINNYSTLEIVGIPESVVVYAQAYGGIISLAMFLMLIITAAHHLNTRSPYKLLKYYFIGLLITNTLSSVSMFSDLLYAHICLIYGLLIVQKEKNISETQPLPE